MINWIITATILTALVITLHYLLRGAVEACLPDATNLSLMQTCRSALLRYARR